MQQNYDVIVVGAGPAGIMTCYELYLKDPNQKVLLIDKGNDVMYRHCPIKDKKIKSCPVIKENEPGCLPACSITSGFGGAGAYSDGKFNITSEFGGWLTDYLDNQEVEDIIRYVDELYLKHGATHDITDPTTDKIKEMMDACYMAKRVRDLLPELPKGVAPSYIHYLDIIQKLESRNVKVKVSDISDALNLPRPGVTRAVKDMEMKGYLRKFSSDEDGRITYITLTEKGQRLSEKYDKKYYGTLTQYLDCISDEDADCAIQTIQKLYEIMQERRINLE